MRIGEAWTLQWNDIDTINKTVRVTPEKGSNPRLIKISTKLLNMLNTLRIDTDTKIFGSRWLKSQRRLYTKQRTKIAYKLKNPRIQRITFHTFRHWKATMEYHKTLDILHVKQLLGHKNINSTLLYTQLIDAKMMNTPSGSPIPSRKTSNLSKQALNTSPIVVTTRFTANASNAP